jgi:hypothetical protein
MNMLKKKRSLIGIAVAVALAFGANSGTAWADAYKFELVGQPSGTTLTIRLVDAASETPVAAAHLFAIHRQWLGIKAQPQFLDRWIALTPVGDGAFTYETNDVREGMTIRLVAQIGARDAHVWGSVRVGQ